MRSALLAIAAFLVQPVYARWRWEDLPIIGLLCIPAFEPRWCVKNRTKYYVEDLCGDDPADPDLQLLFLASIYYETGNSEDTGDLFEKGWLGDCDYCSWEGITCDDAGGITEIDVADGSLTGELPTDIANLSSLESLLLHSNEFTGKIPSELGLLSSLTDLKLHYNSFRGDMPDEVCQLGGANGLDIVISADCGRPWAEVDCDVGTCCDLCYTDSLRPTD